MYISFIPFPHAKKVVPLRGKKGKRIDKGIRIKGKGIREGISGKALRDLGFTPLIPFFLESCPCPFGTTFFTQI